MDQEELKLGLRSIGENLSDSELSAMMGLLVRTGSHHPPAMGQDLNTQNTNAVRAAVAVHRTRMGMVRSSSQSSNMSLRRMRGN